jgi:hypothetical protein
LRFENGAILPIPQIDQNYRYVDESPTLIKLQIS